LLKLINVYLVNIILNVYHLYTLDTTMFVYMPIYVNIV